MTKKTTKKKSAARRGEIPLRPPVGKLTTADRRLLIRAQEDLSKVVSAAKSALEKLQATSPDLSQIAIESHRLGQLLTESHDREEWTFDEDRREIAVQALVILLGKLDKIRGDQVALTILPNDTDHVITHTKELAALIHGAPLGLEEDKQEEFGELTVPVAPAVEETEDERIAREDAEFLAGGPQHRAGSKAAEPSDPKGRHGMKVERGGPIDE
jgi:hypothetical protein